MTWAILGPYLIVMAVILTVGNFAFAMVITPTSTYSRGYDYSEQKKWHARISLAAIAWPLVIPVALLYAVVRIPGWMVKLVKAADLPPLRSKPTTKETK